MANDNGNSIANFERWMSRWSIESASNPDGCVVSFPATSVTATYALQLTIAEQLDEIAVLRSMLATRERQVDELRDQITVLNKRVAIMEAVERRQAASKQTIGDPDWVQPASLLPRGI